MLREQPPKSRHTSTEFRILFGSLELFHSVRSLWTRTNDNVQANSQLKTWLNKAKVLGALAANLADAQALDEWEIGIGATAPVVKMILGAPRDTTFTQLKTKRREYWYYQGETSNRGNVVYQFRVVLENDVVTQFGDGEFRT